MSVVAHSYRVGSIINGGYGPEVVVGVGKDDPHSVNFRAPCFAVPVSIFKSGNVCPFDGHVKSEMLMRSMVCQFPRGRIFDGLASARPSLCGVLPLAGSNRTHAFMMRRLPPGERFRHGAIGHEITGTFYGSMNGKPAIYLTCVCADGLTSCFPVEVIFREPRTFGHIERHLGNGLLHPRMGGA